MKIPKKSLMYFFVTIMIFGLYFNNTLASTEEKLNINNIKGLEKNNQLILVSTSDWKTAKAQIYCYERIKGKWVRIFPSIPAVIGSKGFASNKKEGDKQTPIGKYLLTNMFGTVKRPSGVRLLYRQTTIHDYWIDDIKSPEYNKWVVYKGNPFKRWSSFERLKQPLYKYAIIEPYNQNPIIKGKGSAIFIHIWRSSKQGTNGCIGLSERNLLKIAKWLNPTKKPVIIQGPNSYIYSLTR